MARHDAQWTAPDALRRVNGSATGNGHAPALLRFADDGYMDALQAMLRDAPERLPEYQARFETWRDGLPDPAPARPASPLAKRLGLKPRPQPPAPAPPPATRLPKLYQPAHQRHYLVAAQLVCETAGFPDRVIDRGRQEQAGFVLRRLLPGPGHENAAPDTWEEYAYVAHAWRKANGQKLLVEGEEILPLFPLHHRTGAAGQTPAGTRPRRLLAGVIPVGRREAYLGAATQTGAEPPTSGEDPRLAAFDADVAGPWLNLLERVEDFKTGSVASGGFPDLPPDTAKANGEIERARRTLRNQLQTGSWYVLLDLLGFLERHLPPLWRVLTGQAAAASLNATPALAALWSALNAASQPGGLAQALHAGMSPPVPLSATLAAALQATAGGLPFGAAKARAVADALERVTLAYHHASPATDWPDFLFPLADPGFNPPLDAAGVAALRAKVAAALPPLARPAAIPAAPLGDASNLAWFRIRCVFRRPECEPPHAALLSAPSQSFELAGFFDPDAPARPVRIGLPIDPTPAGLRKFDKKTFLVMSDLLCGQVARFKKLTLGDLVRSVLPWPLHKDLEVGASACPKGGPGIGMVCSLSIPIVTICALILLMIMVSLLDFIFRWLPWFFLCLPLPGLKGKK